MPERVPMPDPQKSSSPVLRSIPRPKDLVCGMSVDPQKPAAKAGHGGKTYYFCSTRCAERFERDPEKFITAPGTPDIEPHPAPPSHSVHPQLTTPVQVASKNARYTCPMHPE